MVFEYRDCKIFYKYINRKKPVTNVFLHGWGVDHISLQKFDDVLDQENSLFVDFPPFGKSGQDPKAWSIFTYANMLIKLCQKLEIKKCNLIGHSFGGRVSIIVASICREEINKLVLIDSAGVKPKRNLKFQVRVFRYKIRRKLGLDVSKYGSEDYKKLDQNMREVFKNIVNTHLETFMEMIRCKTLIMFGENDKVTPIYMAKEINKRIKSSKLVLIKDAGHFCFEEKPLECSACLKKFLEER